MQNYPPYWLSEATERLQDGDGKELNIADVIAPLRHLVNVPTTLPHHEHDALITRSFW